MMLREDQIQEPVSPSQVNGGQRTPEVSPEEALEGVGALRIGWRAADGVEACCAPARGKQEMDCLSGPAKGEHHGVRIGLPAGLQCCAREAVMQPLSQGLSFTAPETHD